MIWQMRSVRLFILTVTMVLFFIGSAFLYPGCKNKDNREVTDSQELKGDLVIFHAGSLAVPFKQLTEEFSKRHPGVKIYREIAGSRECARKICDLGKRCDVMASADSKVIENLLMPNYADWYIDFATNEMVLACRKDKFTDLTVESLPQRLLKTDALGRADPDLDPCGYRTLMVWQLMERYYNRPEFYQSLLKICPRSKTRPKETDLLALLEAGQLDYFFIYRSVARQHDLKYLALPIEVNLSHPSMAEDYSQATVEVTGKQPGTTLTLTGAPIVYGITIPTNAEHPELGRAFVRFVLSPAGQKIMQAVGHGTLAVINPADAAQARALLPKSTVH